MPDRRTPKRAVLVALCLLVLAAVAGVKLRFLAARQPSKQTSAVASADTPSNPTSSARAPTTSRAIAPASAQTLCFVLQARDTHASIENARASLVNEAFADLGACRPSGGGRFCCPWPEDARISIRAPGFQWRTVGAEALDTEPHVVELDLAGCAAGKVLDPRGQPVAGAHVFLEPLGSYVPRPGQEIASTGADGAFRLTSLSLIGSPSLKLPRTLRATFPEFAPGRMALEVEAGRCLEDLVVRLEEGCSIRGRVRDEAGIVVSGADLLFVEHQHFSIREGNSWGQGAVRTTTDGFGRFELTHLPCEGGELVGAAGDATGELSIGAISGEGTEVELALRLATHVSGRVLGSDDRPVSRARVFVISRSGASPPAGRYAQDVLDARQPVQTDDDGRFSVPGRWTSSVIVRAELDGAADRTIAEPGDSNVELRLAPLTQQAVRVFGPDGAQVEHASLDLQGGADERVSHVCRKQPCVVERLRKGIWKVQASDEELGRTEVITAKVPSETPLELRFPPLCIVSGRVSDEDGKSLAGAEIENLASDDFNGIRRVSSRTGPDGRFEISLPVASRELQVRASGFRTFVQFMTFAPCPIDVGEIRVRRGLSTNTDRYLLGLGIELASESNHIVVNSAFRGSPAERAGLRAGDVITEVDGEDASGWTTSEFFDHMRKFGARVQLTVERAGRPLHVWLSRERIRIE